jgi:hypothetical protein
MPCTASLQVGFTSEGRLLALDMDLYNNAGNSLDLSHSIMDRALLHFDVVYRIPNARARVSKARAGALLPLLVLHCIPRRGQVLSSGGNKTVPWWSHFGI